MEASYITISHSGFCFLLMSSDWEYISVYSKDVKPMPVSVHMWIL